MSLPDRFSLAGKRLFITGGSRGLGREMALAIAEAGADVILTGRDRESLEATAADIRALGREAIPLAGDAGDPARCEAMCREALEKHGPIDILINNVGGRLVNVPVEDQSLDDWRRIMDLNVTSTFLCTREIGGAMVRRGAGGRVINIASISGMIANRGIGGRSYETAKAAILQFTRATAADWAPRGVTVNAICPGGFMTAPNRRWSREHPEVIAEFEKQIPMGRFGDPEDLGPLAVYLAGDASRYMTGAALVIDGGYTLW
ncbi:MAG: glucose 1-dehydrogenase [Verrucomicrobiae bacterium]|nr:glucose 1-dehydrogenase [Verrucomicrobiae bacterium]MCP5539049.1 glucose 1-dehydrogenase [Akkermansiaceae bacterium]MCP5551206.1 glucose 1-dehydrogenase [Akkermansiaceae bacterium]